MWNYTKFVSTVHVHHFLLYKHLTIIATYNIACSGGGSFLLPLSSYPVLLIRDPSSCLFLLIQCCGSGILPFPGSKTRYVKVHDTGTVFLYRVPLTKLYVSGPNTEKCIQNYFLNSSHNSFYVYTENVSCTLSKRYSF